MSLVNDKKQENELLLKLKEHSFSIFCGNYMSKRSITDLLVNLKICRPVFQRTSNGF